MDDSESWENSPVIVGEHITSYGNMREAARAALADPRPDPIPPHTFKGMAVTILVLLDIIEQMETGT